MLFFPLGSEITLPVEPFISLGGVLIATLVTGGFGLLGIYLKSRLDNLGRRVTESANGAHDAKRAAEAAVTLSAPTGNGYASRTEQALARIEDRLGSLDNRIERVTTRLERHLTETSTP